MKTRLTILLALVTAFVALAAAPAMAKKKPAKGSAAIARQIAALERTTNTLSGEIAALTAEAGNLEASVHAPPAAPLSGIPIPAPPAPAGGDFGGSFPAPKLLPGTVGAQQLGEGSVTTDQVPDGSVGPSKFAPGTITGDLLAPLASIDFGAAVAGKTLGRRRYVAGESKLFEEELGREQTLTLSTHCLGRSVGGGWSLVPGELNFEIMASVPAFISGGQTTEHDWTVIVHDRDTDLKIRNRLDVSGLCIS
jgi:hypothetical protein